MKIARNVKEALLWKKVDNEGTVQCKLCRRYCIIKPGKYGACGVRKNVGGVLYTIVYGLLTAVNLDPIEKKPLTHFMPGASALSISTVGCNFFCQFCQNWEISQSRLEEGLYGSYHEPEEIVRLAKYYEADAISYTYNEPTIFYEYMMDVARLAKREGIANTIVTNGYMSDEAIQEMDGLLDAATVDFKGGGNKNFYRKYMGVPNPDEIFSTLQAYKEKKVFIEITNLVVPKIGDFEEDVKKLARWIVENLGPETPFHLLRFHPDYKLTWIPATPVSTLEKLANIARNEGLMHVYIGNVWGHPLESTYCPKCGRVVIKRTGFYIYEYNLDEQGRCIYCGYKLNVVPRRKMRWAQSSSS
ncbi:MAG: AmmeMemoRadiSam system radical SAM enzyme [Fervidicoccaceae archaeon]|nr:AmmeMemoRadiSam system radical SAM enzyme [Fervidicoccaceae archaeon]